MTVSVLRRITGLMPLPITSTAAPALGVAVDVPVTPRQPEGEARTSSAGAPTPAAAASPAKAPPSWTPGVCYHHGHIEVDGQRIGVLVLDDRDASLLPCVHSNADGR